MSLTESLVRSRLQWAGHLEMMADDRLPKRAAELRKEGRSRRRGRPMLRWEDCVKRDVNKAGEETVSSRPLWLLSASINCNH